MKQFNIRSITRFTRLFLSLAVTFSTMAGYVAYSQTTDQRLFYTLLGTFLLSAGASALNQLQEKRIDGLMARTSSRPIPKGEYSIPFSIVLIGFLIFSGMAVLFVYTNRLCFYLGLLNVIWYNVIYTYLKRLTAFAVVPGSLTGAIPVLMGWTAAGGSLSDPPGLFIAFFIFLWQIPHFWLLLMMHAEEYRAAGLPVLTDIFNSKQLERIIFAWIACSCIFPLLLVHYKIIDSFGMKILLIIVSLIFLAVFSLLFWNNENSNIKKAFGRVNLYMVLVMLIVVLDKIFMNKGL